MLHFKKRKKMVRANQMNSFDSWVRLLILKGAVSQLVMLLRMAKNIFVLTESFNGSILLTITTTTRTLVSIFFGRRWPRLEWIAT